MTDLELALLLADAADAISVPAYTDPTVDLAVVDKPDGSQVTRFDVEIEERLRALLAEHRPDDSVLGEEHGLTGAGRRRWVIDPIDGTGGFIERRVEWSTLIMLEDAGVPTVGVVSMPSLGVRWWGGPDGAHRSVDGGTPRPVVARLAPTGRFACLPEPDLVIPAFRDTVAGRARGLASAPPSDWTTYPALMVCIGDLDLAIHEGREWDVAALDAIARAAGADVERHVSGDVHLLVVSSR